MSDPYLELLDATVAFLEDLKRSGEQWVRVTPEALAALAKPPARPIESRASTPARVQLDAPAREPVAAQFSESAAPISAAVSNQPPDSAAAGAFAQLRDQVLACQKCPHLVRSRKNVVFGVGNIQARLMFVGEAPGADEDVKGEPFVGAAGQLLTRIIQTMGLSRETVYIANILKCRPDTPGQAYGNRKPTSEEMNTCLPYLLQQIRLIRPEVVVALGATAMEGLFGRAMPISKVRGHWQMFESTPVMPTYHPSFLLRNQAPAVKREVWEDMLQVLEKLALPISERQRNYFKS